MYMCLHIHTLVSQFRFGGMVGVKCEAWGSLLSPYHGPKYNTKTCNMFPENRVMKDHNGKCGFTGSEPPAASQINNMEKCLL